MSQTNLNFYKTFLAVYEAGSISQAGEHLCIASTTVGYQIRELEKQLNAKLFSMHPRGVTPTPAGVELYDIMKPVLITIRDWEMGLQEFNENSTATLRIKFPTYFGSQIMSGYVAAFKKKYRNVHLEVLGRKKQEGVDLLIDNKIDISFSTGIIPHENDQIGAIVVKELTTTLFASKEFAKKYLSDNKVTKEQLEHLPMISLDKTYAVRGILEELGIVKNPVVEVETTDIMLSLVAANLGIGHYANEFFDSQNDRFVKIELYDIETPKFYLTCLYNKKYCSKAAKAFISLLRNQMA